MSDTGSEERNGVGCRMRRSGQWSVEKEDKGQKEGHREK